MDKISRSLMNEFARDHQLAHLPEDQQFEHFAAYVSISRHYSETFDTTEIVTGSGGDTGIDAIATIVNGTLVTDSEEIEELVDRNGFLEVTFIFVQAERSSHFETQKIGQTGFGVLDFSKTSRSCREMSQ